MIKYKTILADPPWSYRNKNTGGSMNSGSKNKYPTLDIDKICNFEINNLKIKEITEKDSVLYLWVTVPMINEGLRVMNEWGFKYKTMIFWNKIGRLGIGFWFRGQVEICLFGIKGKVKAYRSKEKNIIQSKPRKHSQKPTEMYWIIDKYSENPKLEIFAREKRIGWDSFDNELTNNIQTNIEVV